MEKLWLFLSFLVFLFLQCFVLFSFFINILLNILMLFSSSVLLNLHIIWFKPYSLFPLFHLNFARMFFLQNPCRSLPPFFSLSPTFRFVPRSFWPRCSPWSKIDQCQYKKKRTSNAYPGKGREWKMGIYTHLHSIGGQTFVNLVQLHICIWKKLDRIALHLYSYAWILLDECVGEDKLYAIESSVLGSYFEAMSLCPAFQEPFGTERNHNVASILDGLVTAHPWWTEAASLAAWGINCSLVAAISWPWSNHSMSSQFCTCILPGVWLTLMNLELAFETAGWT